MRFRRRTPKRSSSTPSSSGDEEQVGDNIAIKKGPWKAEEDEVLLKHVNKYGPRDWSSLLSKGLLRRTGKSCRLRWVNKLRPNLKSGCKFSIEEERVVIELQSQLGNKWAKIATYLPGRTDNDVKNFWSSRQKRLARLLHHSQSKNVESKPTSLETCSNQGSQIGESSSFCTFEATEMASCSRLVDSSNNHLMSSSNLVPFDQQNNTESNDEFFRMLDLDFMGEFATSGDYLPLETLDHLDGDRELIPLPLKMPYSDPVQEASLYKGNEQSGEDILKQEPATPDSLFDDLPSDILDQIESLPSPPPGW